MDFEELKKSLADVEIITETKKKNTIIEDCSGYYTLPCAKQPFEGDVIKLSGDEFYVMFQRYSDNTEEAFRERLERMDEWFHDKDYCVQKNWINYIMKWLKN